MAPSAAWRGGACVAAHRRLLERAGVARARGGGRAHAAHRALALGAPAAYVLQECVYAYQVRGDMEKFSRVMFLLLCHVTSLVKQLAFHADADRVDELIASLDDGALAAEAERAGRCARVLLARTAARARLVLRLYAGCAALTCALWLLYAAAARARGARVEFPFWTGVDPGPPAAFCCVLLYSYYVTTLVAIANTTMDALVATILSQCTTQLTILRMNLENLVEEAEAEAAATGRSEEGVLMRLFVRCLRHYDKINETAALVQDIFGVPILVQFVIGGWILCMAAYKLVSVPVPSIEFASMALFLVCILTELFLYCYYGSELTEESSLVAGAAYAVRWERSGAGARLLRRALLVLMERARRPLRPAAARVVPLSLHTFLRILKSSYTFYAVLRQTK